MTRSFLTRMLGAAAALMMALSVFAGCRVYTGWRTVRLSGDVQETTVYGSGASDGWTVEIEKLSFSDSENAVIRLVPSDSVRIEAKYSGDFADYGFEITAKNGKIRIGTNHNYNYIADVFEITVYADFDHVELSGGCSLEIDASGAEELRLDISGACDCLVENAAAKRLEIELSGAANINISGTAQTFVVDLSGAADVAAKIACRGGRGHSGVRRGLGYPVRHGYAENEDIRCRVRLLLRLAGRHVECLRPRRGEAAFGGNLYGMKEAETKIVSVFLREI